MPSSDHCGETWKTCDRREADGLESRRRGADKRRGREHGVKLLCGHTHSFDPPVRKMRQIVRSGELGKLCMINSWNYNESCIADYQ